MLTNAIKRRMHRDICADPVLHGLVLNMYLNGEEYPHRVDDYFPVVDSLEPELGLTMRAHWRDEDKHIALYRKALERLQQPVLRLPITEIFNHVIRSHTRDSFAIDKRDQGDRKRLKLAHFLAHLHFLETRVARSLEFHLDGCEHSPSAYPRKVVAAVLADEQRHADYTREAVLELLPRAHAGAVLQAHRSAERIANVDFSHRQLSQLLRDHHTRFPPTRRWMYRGATFCLKQVLRHA